ncbi:retrovirus-related pol polyprotein from transposon TNT 1-94, partial [Tanacetum coccineum]
QSQGYTGSSGKNQALGARVVNTVGNTGANQTRVIRCYNCNSEGHIAKQCTTKKMVKDSKWFKDKMLLAQAQEAGVVLNDEQQDFLANGLEEINDCEDLQLQATTNFKADHVDAYDLDCDDEATANAIFMANLSPVGSTNGDTVEPHYDSNILSKVPHYDTYHDTDVLNPSVQEMGYIENIVSNNESYGELTSNNNVISYTDYMVTIGNDPDNYVPPLVQKNDMILSVVEQMKSQVEKCNTVSSLVKEREHIKLEYKKLYDSIKQTRAKTKLQTNSLQPKLNDQIYENNKLKEQLKAKFFESQFNQHGTSVNTKLSKTLTSGTKLYSVTSLPKSKVIPKVVEKNDLSKLVTSHLTTNKIIEKCTKVLAPVLLKIESEPINAYFKNNRALRRDYLNVPKEHVATLHELLEEARALKILDEHIGHASKFTKRI